MTARRAPRGDRIAAPRSPAAGVLMDAADADPPVGAVAVRAVVGRLLAMSFLVLAAAGCGRALAGLPALDAADAAGVAVLSAATSPLAAQVAVLIDVLFGGPVAPFVALAVLIAGFQLTRSRRRTARMAALILVPWAASAVLKAVVRRPRPEAALSAVDLVPTPASSSFPSGHTAFAAALVCAILLTVAAGRARRLLLLPGVAVIVLVAWSRVALGVHHPIDVLVSATLMPTLSVLLAGVLAVLIPLPAGEGGRGVPRSGTGGAVPGPSPGSSVEKA